MSEINRWAAFTPRELLVINEALNCAFEASKSEMPLWDAQAQEIAATIPAVDDQVAAPELRYLNEGAS